MTETTTTASAEDVLRKYLLFLEDPGKLRDEEAIQKAQQAVDEAQDPIDKLKAKAELAKVSNVDEGPLRQGFVSHAKAWADELGIPLSAFQDMKVPDEVLQEAGFDLPAPGRRGPGRATGAGKGRQRAKAVPADEIKAYILTQEGTFTLADVMSGIGGSPATVRKAVEELIAAGQVEKLGPVQDYQGRGRAPVEYRRV